jgi:hypothetical protein
MNEDCERDPHGCLILEGDERFLLMVLRDDSDSVCFEFPLTMQTIIEHADEQRPG